MRSFSFVLFGLVASPAALADGTHLKPGLYEITSSTEMEGMGARAQPATSRCITPDEAVHPHKSVRAPEGCEMSELKTTGNTARWSVTCHMHGGTQTGTGEVPAK